jgi:hypothetical protein
MEAEGIQQHLWLRQHPNNAIKMVKPHASFVLRFNELHIFLSRFRSLKLPIDYGASIVKYVLDKKLGLMKSHDYHMLM